MNQPQFVVVKNHENQYSVWSADSPVPSGWYLQDKKGTRDECLEYIRQVWTDMTPASLKNGLGT